MTTNQWLILAIIIPTAILGVMCVWLAVRLQRAERELQAWRATYGKRSDKYGYTIVKYERVKL